MTSSKSANGVTIDSAVCRCCRTMKKCRLLTHEYLWMGTKETYSEIFVDCFGLLLSHLEGDSTEQGVCATCVGRLREASAFRLQVLRSEELFLREKIQLISDEKIESNVKLEPESGDAEALVNQDETNSMDECNNEESNIFTSDVDNVEDIDKVEMRATDASEICDNKSYDIRPRKKTAMHKRKKVTLARKDKAVKQSATMVKNRKLIIKNVKLKTIKSDRALKTEYDEDASLRKPMTDDVEHMMETNLINLVELSYVCPFSNRFSSYYCFYCGKPYTDPSQLREHTHSHKPNEYKCLFKKRNRPKLDVTRIDCRLCPVKVADLDTFKTHITGVHNKSYYATNKDMFLKFRLTDDNLACYECGAPFPYFEKLYKHMTQHYSSFICDVCGEAFLDENKLKGHLSTHDSSKYICSLCGKGFATEQRHDFHLNTAHKKSPIISCLKCDALLYSYYERRLHMSQVHGFNEKFQCNECHKVYYRKHSLNEHYRRVHLNVKRHQCEFCLEKFFTPTHLKDHITTHTGEKNYRCEFCDKCYPRLKTLQQHIRIHTNDRRYKCQVCGSAFVQNVSLKCHMKSHHPDYLMDK